MSNKRKYKSFTWCNNKKVPVEQNEQQEDVEDSKSSNITKWYKTKNKEEKIVWRNGLVDKCKIPLFNGRGEYQPRVIRNQLLKERNKREIYYRNNPQKSMWKKNLNNRQRMSQPPIKVLVKDGVKI